ncbi:MAG: cysteine hydrolase family protein [Pseudomonadota bacterium]
MIPQFSSDTALLLIDVQQGVNVLTHWGGPTGRRNNLDAEPNMVKLLGAWRRSKLPVAYTQHDSREAASPLKLSEPGGAWIDELTPEPSELVVCKDVNSGFIGTNLEIELRRRGVKRLVVTGFFTNMCVETTVRMAGNMGFDTYLVHDACATTNRVGPDGSDREPELVHDMTVANLHGEFCTAIDHSQALGLLDGDADDLERVQGNE